MSLKTPRHRKVTDMKCALAITTMAVALAAFAADATAPRKVRPRGTAKQSGGIVERGYNGKVLRVYNAQKAVPPDVVAKAVRETRLSAQLPIEVVPLDASDGVTIAGAAKLANERDVGAAVVMAETPGQATILSSPDGRWAILNVAGIGSDAAKAEQRFRKLLWNAVAHALGAGNTGDRGCVLRGFCTMQDLDGIAALNPSPMAHNAMIEVAATRGIGMISFASYRTACQQGWAPAPTNDVQKAIWDETRKMPEKPIQIKFDPKRGK